MSLPTTKNELKMTKEEINVVYRIESVLKQLPQETIATEHIIHGGIYSRTIFMPKGLVITSAEIKIPTTLTICGQAKIYLGNNLIEADGYIVVPASAGRKQVIYAVSDVYLTMSFKTSSTTIEEVEQEFTDYYKDLISRHEDAVNIINITGE